MYKKATCEVAFFMGVLTLTYNLHKAIFFLQTGF